MPKALITTIPFAEQDRSPVELLAGAGVEYIINPTGRKVAEQELADMIVDADVLIAGTEPITDRVMSCAHKLKLISRVGIGLDSVDLLAAERRGICVSYTPDAPAPAVADLTLALMLSVLRFVQLAILQLHDGIWHRHFGRRMKDVTVGIIGTGRIGARVLRRLAAFGSRRILVNDLKPDSDMFGRRPGTTRWWECPTRLYVTGTCATSMIGEATTARGKAICLCRISWS